MKRGLAICGAVGILGAMLTRRGFMGTLVGAVAASFLTGTSKVVGWNPAEQDALGIGDGWTGRIVDPTTGAGVFNPNLDPAVVGIDPLTGSLAPTGTDMSFGAAVRRQVQTNVINGDFAVLPPLGANTNIVSDPNDARYNPLPGWTWTPDPTGLQSAQVVADATFASGYVVTISGINVASPATLSQLIPVPMSKGQQYRVLLSLMTLASGASFSVVTQFFRADGVTAIGSTVSTTITGVSNVETKYDAGLVPRLAAYFRIAVTFGMSTGPVSVGEVRCAFLPAEATVGLRARVADTAAITTTETQVVGITIPAGTLTAFSVYEIDAWGNVTSTAGNVVTFRIRIGTTTLTGNIPEQLAPTATATAANNSFHLTGLVTVRSTGAGGTIIGALQFIGQDAQPFTVRLRASQATGTVVVNTDVANILELTAQTAAGTTSVTFQQATIKCIMAS